MSMISKELLSEVLQQNVISVYEQRNQHRYTTSNTNGAWVSGSDSAYIIQYKIVNYVIECEPFIGKLPSFLKEHQCNQLT